VSQSKTKSRSEKLQDVVKVAEGNKNAAIIAATQPLGVCSIIAAFLLIIAIAPPAAIVLLLLA